MHHNLIGTNKVTLFKAPHDIALAKFLYKEIIKSTHHRGHIDPDGEVDIFDTFKFPIEVGIVTAFLLIYAYLH